TAGTSSVGVKCCRPASLCRVAHSMANVAMTNSTILPHSPGATYDGTTRMCVGGVGHNVAAAMALLGARPRFVSIVGTDALGAWTLQDMANSHGLDTKGVLSTNHHATPSACVVIDATNGECQYVIASMEAIRHLDVNHLDKYAEAIRVAPLVVLDANLSPSVAVRLLSECRTHNVPVLLEPTDVSRCGPFVEFVLKQHQLHDAVTFATPNEHELRTLMAHFDQSAADSQRFIECLARQLMQHHMVGLRVLVVTLGARGAHVFARVPNNNANAEKVIEQNCVDQLRVLTDTCAHTQQVNNSTIVDAHYSPEPFEGSGNKLIVSVSGAGDSFAGAFAVSTMNNCTLGECVRNGFSAARATLQSELTVSLDLTQHNKY
ncbi:Ribokinase, partial [Fragariocoptes setiger]